VRDYPIPLLVCMKPIEIHEQWSETCNDGVMDVKNVRVCHTGFADCLLATYYASTLSLEATKTN